MMEKTTAANLALALVALAWPLALYGALSPMGDPAGDARAAAEAARKVSWVLFFAGMLSLAASIGLAGYAFTGAKYRAGIALAGALLPLLAYGALLMWL